MTIKSPSTLVPKGDNSSTTPKVKGKGCDDNSSVSSDDYDDSNLACSKNNSIPLDDIFRPYMSRSLKVL